MTGTTFVLHAQSPTQAIVKAVCTSFLDNTNGEQIVVTADSPSSSVWTPWPVPLFRDRGELCIVAPTTAAEQYFKVVPGTQFYDEFSEPKQLFANRRSYTNSWQKINHVIAVTNGVLRIATVGDVEGGVLIRPPEDVVVKDFYASVDILSWTTSSNNWSVLSIAARGRMTGPNGGNGYIGGLSLNHNGIAGSIGPFIYDGSVPEIWGEDFNIAATPPPYRIEFYGVGRNLTFRVLNLTTKEVIREQTVSDTTFTQGWVGVWVNNEANIPGTYEIIADNLFITGTK